MHALTTRGQVVTTAQATTKAQAVLNAIKARVEMRKPFTVFEIHQEVRANGWNININDVRQFTSQVMEVGNQIGANYKRTWTDIGGGHTARVWHPAERPLDYQPCRDGVDDAIDVADAMAVLATAAVALLPG